MPHNLLCASRASSGCLAAPAAGLLSICLSQGLLHRLVSCWQGLAHAGCTRPLWVCGHSCGASRHLHCCMTQLLQVRRIKSACYQGQREQQSSHQALMHGRDCRGPARQLDAHFESSVDWSRRCCFDLQTQLLASGRHQQTSSETQEQPGSRKQLQAHTRAARKHSDRSRMSAVCHMHLQFCPGASRLQPARSRPQISPSAASDPQGLLARSSTAERNSRALEHTLWLTLPCTSNTANNLQLP